MHSIYKLVPTNRTLMCSTATGGIHLDKQVSSKIPIARGVRQGEPISPKPSSPRVLRKFFAENFFARERGKGLFIEREILSDLATVRR